MLEKSGDVDVDRCDVEDDEEHDDIVEEGRAGRTVGIPRLMLTTG